MKYLLAIALLLWMGEGMILAAPQKAASPSQDNQPEVVRPSASLPPSTQVAPGGEGYMEPQQVKDLLKRVYLAEFRTNDLLTQVHPENWKMPEGARSSFLESFGALRRQMGALEEWRAALDQRPDSMYLAYMRELAPPCRTSSSPSRARRGASSPRARASSPRRTAL